MTDPDKAPIFRHFELDPTPEPPGEEELLRLLTLRIEYLIEHRMDYLLSLLYRMDVLEPKIKAALHPLAPDPPALGLAKRVLERQKERNQTRKQYPPPTILPEDDDGEDWSF